MERRRVNFMVSGLTCILIVLASVSSYAQAWKTARSLPLQTWDESIKVRRLSGVDQSDQLVFEYAFPKSKVAKPVVTSLSRTKQATRVRCSNAPMRIRVGEPVVPVIPMQCVLPAGKTLASVQVKSGKMVSIEGSHVLEHGTKPVPLIPSAKWMVQGGPNEQIYSSDSPYPAKKYEVVSIQHKKGIAIAHINFFPVLYHPLSGKLYSYESIQVCVSLKEMQGTGHIHRSKRSLDKSLFNSVENPEELESYENSETKTTATVQPYGMCDPALSYQYVIITNAEMRDAETDYTLTTLADHKTAQGIDATIVTVDSIYTQYEGVDNPEKIRNFIIDAYANWETEYVLLAGDVNIIPVRYLYVADDGGTNIPSDLYYQCLDGPYNGDGDSYWGEPTDGIDGGDVDLMADVAVGRASAEDVDEMSNFVYKTINYDTSPASTPSLRKAMMAGEYLGFGGVSDYATASMEEIRLGSDAHGYTTVGFVASPLFTVDTLYDSDNYTWPSELIISHFNSDSFSIYNHLGHANETNVMKVTNGDVDNLTNSEFFFVYSQGCYPGDYTVDCIAEHFTTSHRHGAFAVVFNSRYGWGQYNSTDGPSQRFDRQFWDAYFGEYIYTYGNANADSHEDNLWDIDGELIRWCMYETNLFGDPQLYIRGQSAGAMVHYHSHTIDDSTGNNDGIINPGESVGIRASVINLGIDSAYGVNLTISESDEYVSITDNSAAVGDVPCCGATKEALDNFMIQVAGDCPTPRVVTITMTAQDNDTGEWISTFEIPIYSSNQVSGTVTIAASGAAAEGAVVSFNGPISGSVTTNAQGYYMFGAIDGEYAVSVQAEGYLPTEPIIVTVPPSVDDVDFALVRPLLAVTPELISDTLAAGDSTTVQLILANTGDAAGVFSIAVRDETESMVLPAEKLYDASHFVPLAKRSRDTRVGKPVSLSKGGPDAFGYRWSDSDEPGGPVYTWEDISETGTLLSSVSECDDCYEMIALSFSFPFYGTIYDSVFITSNGYITFGSGYTQYTNYPIPSESNPPNLVAGFFDDLLPGEGGNVYCQDFGDRFIVQFDEVMHIDGSGSYTYQMVLEQSGRITFYYKNLTGTLNNCTVGIQNSTQDDGLMVVYNSEYLKNEFAVRLQAAPPWLTVMPESGTVPIGGEIELTAALNTKDLFGGLYNGVIEITHNDPTIESPYLVPCNLTVDGMRQLEADTSVVAFGNVWQNDRDTIQLTMINNGNEATTISELSTTTSEFSCNDSLPLQVPPFSTVDLNVLFNPTSLGEKTDELTITSDAEDNPVITVALNGTCVLGPEIVVSPNSFLAEVGAGDTALQTLTIANNGGDDLLFKILAKEPVEEVEVDYLSFKTMVKAADQAKRSIVDTSDTHPESFKSLAKDIKPIVSISKRSYSLDGKNVLILRDNIAWGFDVNEPLLTEMGANVSIAGSNEMDTILLEPYDMILFESEQNAIFYTTYSDNIEKFEAYLNNGGIIEFHCATFPEYGVANLQLPGGMQASTQMQSSPTNTVVLPEHPVVNGAEEVLEGFPISVAGFENLPNNAVIIVENESGNPTTVEYRVGNGVLLATGMLWEPDYFLGWNVGDPLLPNALAYCLSIETGPSWIVVEPDTGTVSPGSSLDVAVLFNSLGLIAGDYNGFLSIEHNAPQEGGSPLDLPCTLMVDGMRRLEVNPTSIAFGDVWMNDVDTMKLTMINNGNEATNISSLVLTGDEFSCNAVAPVIVEPFDFVTVDVIFQPISLGEKSGTLAITSDAEDNPSIAVALTGTCVLGPEIVTSPNSFQVAVAAGDSSLQTLTITNNGGDDLLFKILAKEPEGEDSTLFDRTVHKIKGIRKTLVGTIAKRTGKSDAPSQGDVSVPSRSKRNINALEGKNVLILRDQRAWGFDVNEPLLTEIGANVSIAGSNEMDTILLEPYDVILFESQQTTPFYNTYLDNIEKFETYLYNGGVIEFHCATYTNYRVPNLVLPGGMQTTATEQFSDLNYVVNPDHPVVYESEEVVEGSYASHEGFENLPDDAIIILENESGNPTTVEYRVGNGLLLATGMTWEWGYYWGETSGDPLLPNALAYSLIVETGPSWLSVNQDTGTVQPGNSIDIQVLFNSAGLIAGDYIGILSIEHNAPQGDLPLDIPCTLMVDGMRRLEVNSTSIAFGDVWMNDVDTMVLTMINKGNEATNISSVVLTGDEFSCDAATPVVVDPFDSVTVDVIFHPISLGEKSGTLAITSDAEDNPSITVALSGVSVPPPEAQLDPHQLTYDLAPGDAPADQTCVLTNIGGAPLAYNINRIEEFSSPLGKSQKTVAPPLRLDLIYSDANYRNEFIYGKVIVGFKKGLDGFGDKATLPRIGTLSVKKIARARSPKTGSLVTMKRKVVVVTIEGKKRNDVLDAIKILRSDPNVAYAEPDYKLSMVGIPDDTDFDKLYGMHNTGQTGGTADADIDAPEAWDSHTGNGSILLGVIDTGIDYLHPDLIDNIWTNPGEIPENGIDDDNNGFIDDVHGWDFANDDNDPMDGHFHGTHCAGTIAGSGNNGQGVAGVMWQAQVVAIKFLNDGGSGSTEDAIESVNYAAAMGISITSNSWGGGGFSQALMDAIASGGMFVASAGNSGMDADVNPEYPAAYDLDNIISVAATDHNDALASFSNYGLVSVDLGAPGVEIYSCAPNNSYQFLSGTSMSAPHVSGAAGLLWSYNPFLSAVDVKQLLLENTDPKAALDGKSVSGGRLNVQKALAAAGPGWLSVVPMDPDSLAPSESRTFTVTANAEGLFAGTWEAGIIYNFDDPLLPVDTVRVTVNVAACKSLEVSDSSLLFDTTWVGTASTIELLLINSCNSDVEIEALTFTGSEFSTDVDVPLIVPAFEEVALPVQFAPVTTGTFSGSLTISSDAEDNPSITVALLGSSLPPPEITIDPSSFHKYLITDEECDDTLRIINNGGDVLTFKINGAGTLATKKSIHDIYGPEHFVKIPRGSVDTRLGKGVALGSGGPDLFGYRWIDSDEANGPEFTWEDISETGTMLDISDCLDCFEAVPLSFTVSFYGNEFDTMYVSTKGNFTFGVGSYQWTNYPLPTPDMPSNLIAAFFDDLNPELSGEVYFQDFGDHAIVQYNNVGYYSGDGTCTFQIMIESNGAIQFQYLSMTGLLTSATVGIQNQVCDDGLNIVYNSPYIHDSLAIKIIPLPEWLSISQDTGTVAPNDTLAVGVHFSAVDVEPSELIEALSIVHNVPDSSNVISVPCTLTVSPIPDPPVIVLDPFDCTVAVGETASFAVRANGEKLSYQWKRDGVEIDGATGPFYTTPTATIEDNGVEYECVVSNPGGSVTSNPAVLTVTQ